MGKRSVEEIQFDIELYFHPENFKDLSASGVYFLFDDEEKLLYIGRSVDIGSRLLQHYKPDSQFGSARQFIRFVKIIRENSLNKIDSLEKYLIQKYQPPLNGTFKDVDISADQEKIRDLENKLESKESTINYLRGEVRRLQNQISMLQSKLDQYEDMEGLIMANDFVVRALGQPMEKEEIRMWSHDSDTWKAVVRAMAKNSERYLAIKDIVSKVEE